MWKKALERVSAGALTLDIKYIADFETFVGKVESTTGISNAEGLGPALAAALVEPPFAAPLQR